MNLRSRLFYLYLALAIIYSATFLLPRQISTLPVLASEDYRLLSLTILIPQLLIWYVAFYGYAKLRRYTKLIRHSPDGVEVSKITDGVMVLAIGLPVNAISTGILNTIGQQIGHPIGLIILKNFITLLLPLIGIVCISRGAHGLAKLSKHRARLRSTHLITAIYALVAVLFCYVTFSSDSLRAIYYMPIWLIAVTIIAPYLYTWYIGIQAAYEIHLYSRNAPGRIYRRTWNMLASGIGAITVVQIALQYMTTITVQFTSLRALRLFLTVYVILAAFIVGYLLIAIGAKRLQKIEEV